MQINNILLSSLFLLSLFMLVDANAEIGSPPTNLQIIKVTPSSVELTWNPPVDTDLLVGYKMEVKINNEEFTMLESSINNTDTTYLHTDLNQNTIYTYRISAVYQNDIITNPSENATAFVRSEIIEVRDEDDDGIFDSVDRCPLVPENFNGYEDEDGCIDKIPIENTVPTWKGFLELAKSEYETERKVPIVLQLSGEINEDNNSQNIVFFSVVSKSNENILGYRSQTVIKNDNSFSHTITLPLHIQDGEYTIISEYQDELFPPIMFNVKTKSIEPKILINTISNAYVVRQPIEFVIDSLDLPPNAIKQYYWQVIDENNNLIKPTENHNSVLEYKFARAGTYNVKLSIIDNFDKIYHITTKSPIIINMNSTYNLNSNISNNDDPISSIRHTDTSSQTPDEPEDYSIIIMVAIGVAGAGGVFFWLFNKNQTPQFK